MPEMGTLEKIKGVMVNPSKFFVEIKKEEGVKDALVYLAALDIVYLVLYHLLHFFFDGMLPVWLQTGTSSILTYFGVAGLIYVFAIAFIFSIVFFIISTGFIHVFAMLLKGKGKFSDTFKALAYGGTPGLLLGWIPILNIVFGLWSIYLNIKGVSKLHKVSMLRAFAITFVIPICILLIIMLAVAWFVYSTYYSLTAQVSGLV